MSAMDVDFDLLYFDVDQTNEEIPQELDFSSLLDDTGLFETNQGDATYFGKAGESRENPPEFSPHKDIVFAPGKRDKNDLQEVATSTKKRDERKRSKTFKDAVSPERKRQPVPGHQKDDKYWEKRNKNNKSAKRSRDLRREKEKMIASKAATLEMEIRELKAEVRFLRQRNRLLNKRLMDMSTTDKDFIDSLLQ